ncbi:cyclase [Sorangium cellulosum]|uniref:Cyclase n=1 Tax=Sorangium cellulosum TaxID=56 RepID=A0A4P2QYL0_SORCE|nr:cyclase [Sorangium cellulosum]WCQ93965.1 hypothetical protein NQZ70_06722 [Sorangium sp. Soce836]
MTAALPPFGSTLSCFPHELRGAPAGWTRAGAVIEARDKRDLR